ncbi:hypothetical protein [Streptomyces sp. Tu 2975]|uniref:hypothetical protein n=1 Tax=Streptomyces sp. Tu 2975 TaxID=2676871 RepID=UPI001ABE562D|nr:hypothetical protein [Streptomyces sp. Tu 2975]
MTDIDGPDRRDQNKAAAAASAVQDRTAQGAQVVKENASGVAGTAKQQAAGVAGEARSQAKDLAGQVRVQLREQAQSRTHSLAAGLHRVSDDLMEMSRNARSESGVAGAVRQIAKGGDQVASRIESRGPEGLLGDLQNFARRKPGVFLAGAALAGFAVARAGKGMSAGGSYNGGSEGRYGDESLTAGGADTDALSESSRAGLGQPDPLDTYGQSQPPHYTPGYGSGEPPGPVAAPHTPPAYPRSRDEDGNPPAQGS